MSPPEGATAAPLGRHPAGWFLFAAAVLAVPVVELLRETSMTLAEILPTVNASLNATSGLLLFAGWRAIRAGRRDWHKRLMLAATAVSAVFLVCYLIRFGLTGAHRYPVHDWTRTLYLSILLSHTLLAAVTPFLVVRSIYLALKGRLDAHKRIVKWTLPIWAYVSVTGVVVYVMLYHLAPARMP